MLLLVNIFGSKFLIVILIFDYIFLQKKYPPPTSSSFEKKQLILEFSAIQFSNLTSATTEMFRSLEYREAIKIKKIAFDILQKVTKATL